MPPIPRYSTSYSEPWVAWVMLLLLVMLCLADFFQKGVIIGSFRSITATKERESLFSEVSKSTAGNIFMFIYQAGIVAMTIYLLVAWQSGFGFLKYLLVVLLVCVLALVKYLALRLVVHVFLDKDFLTPVLMHYDNLNVVVCTLIYPITLLGLFAPFAEKNLILILLSLIALFALSIWLLKAFRLFFKNFLAGLYIFLYLCTLEIIPLAALILAVRYLVL